MKILIDVMSGDKAPVEHIKGAVLAADEYNADISVVGDENIIHSIASEMNISLDKINIIHADDVILMDDSPLSVVRSKKNSSMAVGLRMLHDGDFDAFVSSGNTGALVAGATLIVRKIKGIRRAAISTILPFDKPILLMDSGANLEVDPADMLIFAKMGTVYMSKIYNVTSPRIGLLNNGSEHTKGRELQIESYAKLSESKLNFIGNVEGNQIPSCVCDVLVTDGFTGNMVLKYTEGMGKFMFSILKSIFSNGILTKISYLLIKKQVAGVKNRFDSSEHGGAPILGISKPVIKAHGSADARAIKNAVRQAILFVNTKVISDITDIVSS